MSTTTTPTRSVRNWDCPEAREWLDGQNAAGISDAEAMAEMQEMDDFIDGFLGLL